jgi:hypothetical protein
VRVRAKNKHGWGDFSPIISIVAALAPSQTNRINIYQDVRQVDMAWEKPDINGLDITKYEILFRKSDGTYNTTPSCLGDNEVIINKRFCYVTFLTLR